MSHRAHSKSKMSSIEATLWKITLAALVALMFIGYIASNWNQNDTQFPFSSEKPSKLFSTLANFDWNKLLAGYQQKHRDTSEFYTTSENLFVTLLPFLTLPPLIPINTSCEPPPLRYPSDSPPCQLLPVPRKVGIFIQVGFDADTLEIHMNELDDVVDNFFLFESPRTYYLGVRKPLMWEHLQNQPRFAKFIPKVVSFQVDDADLAEFPLREQDTPKGDYRLQFFQQKMHWSKFQKWNGFTGQYDVNDILSFGDVNQVPNRNVVYYLQNCELPSDPITVGIWFPYGNVNKVFRPEQTIKGYGYQHALPAPSFWTVDTAMNTETKGYPVQSNNEFVPAYLLGGMHMTYYGYLPFALAKLLTIIEGSNASTEQEIIDKLALVRDLMGSGQSSEIILRQIELMLAETAPIFKDRFLSMEVFKEKFTDEYEKIVKLPWFYQCNAKRYPAWEGHADPRVYF